MKTDNTFYTKIISNLNRFATQDKVIEYLRQFQFVFVEMNVFFEQNPKFKFMPKDTKNSLMMRELKPGKWDSRMIVTFKLWGKRSPRMGIYLNKKYVTRINKHWKDEQDINFKKLTIRLKFPDAMPDYEERKKWRYEDKKVQKDPNYKPSAFYKQWKDQVIRL